MPREIKSRVWCKNKNDWESHAWCVLPDGGLMDLSRKVRLNMSNHIHELSTGLTDKNGVEIYEGDIVECHGYVGRLIVSYSIDDGMVFCPSFVLCEKSGDIAFNSFDRVKIVGNIHESPELIEGES